MGSKHRVIWSRAKLGQLERLWLQGLSTGEIAEKMGEDFTRNCIIGKSWRMGLPRRRPTPRCTRRGYQWSREDIDKLTYYWPKKIHWRDIRDQISPKLTAHAIKSKAQSLGLKRPQTIRKQTQEDILDLVAPPIEEQKTFSEIGYKDCRYPIGDPLNLNFKYCGRKAAKGPYCKAHYAICYKPKRAKEAA